MFAYIFEPIKKGAEDKPSRAFRFNIFTYIANENNKDVCTVFKYIFLLDAFRKQMFEREKYACLNKIVEIIFSLSANRFTFTYTILHTNWSSVYLFILYLRIHLFDAVEYFM